MWTNTLPCTGHAVARFAGLPGAAIGAHVDPPAVGILLGTERIGRVAAVDRGRTLRIENPIAQPAVGSRVPAAGAAQQMIVVESRVSKERVGVDDAGSPGRVIDGRPLDAGMTVLKIGITEIEVSSFAQRNLRSHRRGVAPEDIVSARDCVVLAVDRTTVIHGVVIANVLLTSSAAVLLPERLPMKTAPPTSPVFCAMTL